MAWSNTRENLAAKNVINYTILCKTISPMLATTPGNEKLFADYIASNVTEKANKSKELMKQELELFGEEEVERKGTTRFMRGRMCHDAKNPFKWYDPKDPLVEVPKDATEEKVNMMLDYQMGGFFKEKIGFLRMATDKEDRKVKKDAKETQAVEKATDLASDFAKKTGKKVFASSTLTNYKKSVDGLIKVVERKIPIILPEYFYDDDGNKMPSVDPNGLPWVHQRPLRAETQQGPRVALASSEVAPIGSMWSCTIRILDPNLLPVVKECLDYGEYVGMLQNRGNGAGRFIWTPIDPKTGEIID